MKRLSPVINKAEQFIRRGEVRHAAVLIQNVDIRAVPLRYCAPLANLMRRCGMFSDALRLSQRAVRGSKPDDKIHIVALAEYCTVLIRIGSVEEAGRKLAAVTSSNEPAVLIARFWYHFTRYEYRESIPLLENWIGSVSDPYVQSIAELNLVEAYFGTGKYLKSKELATLSIKKCESQGFIRLVANGLQLRARCYAELGDFNRSNADLHQALELLKSTETGDAWLIRRQLAINEAIDSSSLAPINKFRSSARQARLWETMRELDFQSLRIRFRSDVLQKLYFGTPYPAYRDRILNSLSKLPKFSNAKIEPDFIWGPRGAPCLDLATGKIEPVQQRWRAPRPLVLLTLRALLRDQYRPLGTREIYAFLFPNEEFELGRSDDRVHQCIARLRKWVSDANLPLRVELLDGGYTLHHKDRPAIALRVPEKMPPKLRSREVSGFIETLRETFHVSQPFTAREVRAHLELSSATAIRRLAAAVKRGELIRESSGKNTTYRFIE